MTFDDDGFVAWYRQEYPRVLAVLAATAGNVEAAREAAAEGPYTAADW